MPLTVNDVFKLMSLRGSLDGLTIEPSGDVSGSEVLKRLTDITVDVRQPSPTVLRALTGLEVMTRSELDRSPLAAVAETLAKLSNPTMTTLRELSIPFAGSERKLPTIATLQDFQTAYRSVLDSFWLITLTQPSHETRALHERLIRAGHVTVRTAQRADSLQDSDVIRRLLSAKVVVPPRWRRAFEERKERIARNAAKLDAQATPLPSGRETLIKETRARYLRLLSQIKTRKALQAKAQSLYTSVKVRAPNLPVVTEGRAGSVLREGPLLGRFADAVLAPPPVEITRTGVTGSLPLDSDFYGALGKALNSAEKIELDSVLTSLGTNVPNRLTDLSAALDYGDLVFEANDACSSIRMWEEEGAASLPPADSPAASEDRPSIRAVGWGDLIVARERLIGYEAREIAHVESVLSGEKKVREHERINKTEELVETETIKTSESERDLQTTDRYELQAQSQSAINEDFRVEAGVNTSGQYGLTKVETSLDVGFGHSSSEAQSTSVQLAKDIVSRSVEKTFESVRRLRRTTINEQIRELNVHSIDNTPGPSMTSMPPSKSGVYLWVEKIHEVELRQYGTRMMLEFHVPEPALSLLEQRAPKPLSVKKPAPLAVGPEDIVEANYLCLTKHYGVDGVEPPPAPFVQIGWAWASRPSESEDENTSEDTVADMIKVPQYYAPVSGRAVISAHPAQAQYVDVFAAVGGHAVINIAGTSFGQADFDFDPEYEWPEGVPVSVRAHGHFDKTLTAQVTLRCQRTTEAFRAWQLRTYESLRQAQQARVRDYERAVEKAALEPRAGLFQMANLPEQELRATEREELKKWSIKALRHPNQFQFNAVELVGDYQEVSALGADFQAPIVRFFEEAFEWRQMSYFTYPYFWGRRDSWNLRHGLEHEDPLHRAFLRAGAARVIVPVTPGYETRVLSYLDKPELNELERITQVVADEVPSDTDAEDLWIELLIHKHQDQAIGSGTLSVTNGSQLVAINLDSRWELTASDLGRELYIGANRYLISKVTDASHFELEEPYLGQTDANARYTSGSVAFGRPWSVRLPTALVILEEDRARLASLD